MKPNTKLIKLLNYRINQEEYSSRIYYAMSVWDEDSSSLMKRLIKTSFEQNPDALTKLLATGKAELTHKYNGVEQDNGRFSKLLMEVRQELASNNTSELSSNLDNEDEFYRVKDNVVQAKLLFPETTENREGEEAEKNCKIK